MEESTFRRFQREVRHFFAVSVMNIAFAALLMAFGLMVVVQEVVSIWETFTTEMAVTFSPVVLIVAVSAMIIGLGWIITSARVFEGIESIKNDLGQLTKKNRSQIESDNDERDEELTRLIVRMLSHYRDNHGTIHRMIYVCMLGSCSIFVLGTIASLEYFSASLNGFSFTIGPNPLLLPSMVIMVAFAIASLISSIYFYQFSRVWDERLKEIEQSEDLLEKTLEMSLG
ncbi:hypothetical protein RJ53_10385 [Methanocalculus chunghsingensis]|uniref:Uncharacterized protein n=1 Tax=Methanocalculus chunghsingensis TaxID=156457 RepID=A0A8J7WBX4_9EURY|nr:hypothetical protein [Methanocalculus chunghsingensis]MBR1369862.1 hypothetical protein [Methanocalculus chunghsingensis]